MSSLGNDYPAYDRNSKRISGTQKSAQWFIINEWITVIYNELPRRFSDYFFAGGFPGRAHDTEELQIAPAGVFYALDCAGWNIDGILTAEFFHPVIDPHHAPAFKDEIHFRVLESVRDRFPVGFDPSPSQAVAGADVTFSGVQYFPQR